MLAVGTKDYALVLASDLAPNADFGCIGALDLFFITGSSSSI